MSGAGLWHLVSLFLFMVDLMLFGGVCFEQEGMDAVLWWMLFCGVCFEQEGDGCCFVVSVLSRKGWMLFCGVCFEQEGMDAVLWCLFRARGDGVCDFGGRGMQLQNYEVNVKVSKSLGRGTKL